MADKQINDPNDIDRDMDRLVGDAFAREVEALAPNPELSYRVLAAIAQPDAVAPLPRSVSLLRGALALLWILALAATLGFVVQVALPLLVTPLQDVAFDVGQQTLAFGFLALAMWLLGLLVQDS